MYRIRLTTGQEQVYPSIQELTAGVQRGEVTAEAEIYHQRTERWLSIESHPHFRMALEGSTATRTSRLKFTRPSGLCSSHQGQVVARLLVYETKMDGAASWLPHA